MEKGAGNTSLKGQMEVVVQPSAGAAVELVAEIIGREVQAKSRPVLGLAAGRTMEAVYARLVKKYRAERLDFSHCRTFNLDEYVGLTGADKHSYRHYMNRLFFNQVNINLRNTHLPDGAAHNPAAECEGYERLIHEAGGIDLQLLGIGQSGHIGFNEPPSDASSRTRVVTLAPETIQQNAPIFRMDTMPSRAITMGVGTILSARKCLLLAIGESKADIIRRTIEGPVSANVPASALQLHSHCIIVLDETAASALSG